MMDYGVEGLEMTRNAFRKSKTCGAGDWNEAYSPLIHNIDDVKIAILGLAHYEFGMLADRWDNRYNAGVAWINHPGVDKIIVETKKHCDYLIIFAHAGVEHIEQPLPEWRDRYRSMIDLGCDAIIGSHPHIAQGWEVYNGKPIVYSLGNFYFFTKRVKARQWHVSLLVTLMLSDKGKIDLNITPLTFSEKYIEVDKSDETLKYLSRVNLTLADDKQYEDYINKICLDKLRSYDGSFGRSGYVKLSDWRRIVKAVCELIRGRGFNSVYLENNLRCESHRWCIARGIKLRDNYQ